jgi:hypothetical protein
MQSEAMRRSGALMHAGDDAERSDEGGAALMPDHGGAELRSVVAGPRDDTDSDLTHLRGLLKVAV